MPDDVALPIVALDLAATVRLIRSAATAQAMAEATQLTWQTYNDSKVLNIIYTVFFWKAKPGWVEVDTGRQLEVLRRADELTATLWKGFHARLAEGPVAVARTIRGFERARTIALDSIRQKFASARAINNDVLEFTRVSIRDLARVKLASDVVLAVAAPAAVGMTYSITATVIKQIDKADGAKVILFAFGREPAKETSKHFVEKGSHLMAREADGYALAVRNAELDIIRQDALMRRRSATTKSMDKAAARLADATRHAASARDAARFARAAHVSLKGLYWGFVAYDVLEAWHDYVEATGI